MLTRFMIKRRSMGLLRSFRSLEIFLQSATQAVPSSLLSWTLPQQFQTRITIHSFASMWCISLPSTRQQSPASYLTTTTLSFSLVDRIHILLFMISFLIRHSLSSLVTRKRSQSCLSLKCRIQSSRMHKKF